MRCPMTAPTSTSWLPTSAAWLPTPTPASTCKGEGEPPRVIGVGISDGDHVVLNVSPLALTGGAEIIVAADKALVACAIDGPTTSIADHTRVECTLLLSLKMVRTTDKFYHSQYKALNPSATMGHTCWDCSCWESPPDCSCGCPSPSPTSSLSLSRVAGCSRGGPVKAKLGAAVSRSGIERKKKSAMVRFSNSTANHIQGSTTIISETSQDMPKWKMRQNFLVQKHIKTVFHKCTIFGAAWHEKSS